MQTEYIKVYCSFGICVHMLVSACVCLATTPLQKSENLMQFYHILFHFMVVQNLKKEEKNHPKLLCTDGSYRKLCFAKKLFLHISMTFKEQGVNPYIQLCMKKNVQITDPACVCIWNGIHLTWVWMFAWIRAGSNSKWNAKIYSISQLRWYGTFRLCWCLTNIFGAFLFLLVRVLK